MRVVLLHALVKVTMKQFARSVARRTRSAFLRKNEYAECYVCLYGCAVVLEAHHIYPVGETGGTDGRLVLICPNCHAIVHKYVQLFHTDRRLTAHRRKECDLLWEYLACIQDDNSAMYHRLMLVIERRLD